MAATSKRIKGLFIKVLSSADGKTSVGTLGSRVDVKHWVTVENLGGYPADLDCRGRITSAHPNVRFDSTRSGDTKTVWTDSCSPLPDRTSRDFSHVTLLPDGTNTAGSEIIHTHVDVSWPQPGRTGTDTLSVTVHR